jgi:hypothetical protein
MFWTHCVCESLNKNKVAETHKRSPDETFDAERILLYKRWSLKDKLIVSCVVATAVHA